MNSVLSAITGHAAILLAVVAILEGVLAAWLFRRNDEMRMQLRRARDAADEAPGPQRSPLQAASTRRS